MLPAAGDLTTMFSTETRMSLPESGTVVAVVRNTPSSPTVAAVVVPVTPPNAREPLATLDSVCEKLRLMLRLRPLPLPEQPLASAKMPFCWHPSTIQFPTQVPAKDGITFNRRVVRPPAFSAHIVTRPVSAPVTRPVVWSTAATLGESPPHRMVPPPVALNVTDWPT